MISIIAGIFGFTGIAAGSAAIAKFLFFAALILFVIFLVLGVTIFKKIT
ncbi:Small integral membrane protein [Mycobacteroides abscessus subsp. abscessus]|nr:Small integral membrane protein [Mycobacteroides abscessus subsp. abscessus]